MSNSYKTEDEKLIKQYCLGDQLAFQELVRRWHKSFCEKAYWLTKDADASKDIAQESWNTIIMKMDTLKEPSKFSSWALRIVFSKSMDWMRSNQTNRKKLENYQNNYESVEEEQDANEALKKALLLAIKKLPYDQQTVIRLFYVEDYTMKDISDLLEISVGTVKSRLFHAREKLKEQLKYRDYEN